MQWTVLYLQVDVLPQLVTNSYLSNPNSCSKETLSGLSYRERESNVLTTSVFLMYSKNRKLGAKATINPLWEKSKSLWLWRIEQWEGEAANWEWKGWWWWLVSEVLVVRDGLTLHALDIKWQGLHVGAWSLLGAEPVSHDVQGLVRLSMVASFCALKQNIVNATVYWVNTSWWR